MGEFSLEQWLPQLPWLGPPFPRLLGILWPWVRQPQELSLSSYQMKPFLQEKATPEVIYENEEEIEFVRDANGTIQKAIRHIRVTKNE